MLAPLLRSNAQGDILALLYLNPNDEFSITDIAHRVDAFPATVHREIERLVQTGVLLDRTVGRSRLVHVNQAHEMYAPLGELLLLSYGPRVVLEPLVAALPGMKKAFIYGSWAARYVGEPGPEPRDVDVLVVGSTTRELLTQVGRDAQERLHREVNVTRVTTHDWETEATAFVETLKPRPLVELRTEGSDK